MLFMRTSPDPRIRAPIKLSGGDARGLLNLVSIQSDVGGRVARSGTPGQLLAIAHAQCSIDPDFLGATAVIQRRFDAVPTGRPAGCRRESAGNYWPEFIGTDGRRPLRRLRVVADDSGPAADEIWIIARSPTMGMTPAHAFT